jgi:hypothetical protein
MSLGLDYVTGPPIAALKAAGVTFVCRYFSEVNALTQVKLLTPAEAKMLSAAGIAIVSNFEWYGNRAAEGFASGVADAHIADAQHKACGGPADRPIYFSVDFNTAATSNIIDYFKGAESVLGIGRVGAYGGYECIKGLFDAGAIRWGWQTYAWSGGAWDVRAHIQQYENGVTLDGHDVDYNRSMHSDFGQWTQGGSMLPAGWHDDGHTLTAPNGHRVVMGFREWVLSHNWDAGNQPLGEEYAVPQVQLHNPGLGAGQIQLFRDGILWFTTAKGVVQEPYLGLEIQAAYALIASQQAEIATLKQQQPPQPALNLADARATLASLNTDVATKLAQALKDLGA